MLRAPRSRELQPVLPLGSSFETYLQVVVPVGAEAEEIHNWLGSQALA